MILALQNIKSSQRKNGWEFDKTELIIQKVDKDTSNFRQIIDINAKEILIDQV